jgi:hypothetical protein
MKKNVKPKTEFEIKTRASFLVDNYKSLINYPNHERATADKRFVYLFRNQSSNLCKIGITNNYRVRFSQLKNLSGMSLQPLLIIELEEDYDESADYIENFLHKYFNDSRHFGEWFNLTIRDILSIRDLFREIGGEDLIDNIEHFFLSDKYKQSWHMYASF